MKSKALKKRLSLQVLLNLEEVFNQESLLAAKAMRKSLKTAAKALVKEFMKRSRTLESKEKKRSRVEKVPVKKATKGVVRKKAVKKSTVNK